MAGLIVAGMAATTWGAGLIAGGSSWPAPEDLWGTLVAARRLLHGNLGGLYTQPPALIAFPGRR